MMPKTGDSSEDPFKSGAQVEVSFEEEGFRGSWFSGTVLRHVSKRTNKKPRLLIQFHTLTAGDDNGNGNAPLRETVDLVLCRPIPPRESRRRFLVGEDVDAFHSDGWWEGIVISVNDDGACRTYAVFFRTSREQLNFKESELRLHREWVYGKWEPPLEDETTPYDESSPPEKNLGRETSGGEVSKNSSTRVTIIDLTED